MANTAGNPSHLLVALDGSSLAESVLPLVRTIGKATGARVTLLHVLEHEAPTTVHGEAHLTTVASAETYLAEVADRLGDALPVGVHVHPNPQRDVALSIAEHAAELNADLIVLAAHGRGGVREWLVGRIPQLVAARAGRPVLIAPAPTNRDLSIVRMIVLPVDQAGDAEAAIPLASRIASTCHAEIHLVTVVPTRATMPGNEGVASVFLPRTTASLLDFAEQEARQMLATISSQLAAAGIAVSSAVLRGDPAQHIGAEIAARSADLVIMATHARTGLNGLLSGSVAPRVVAGAECPVLLIPIR